MNQLGQREKGNMTLEIHIHLLKKAENPQHNKSCLSQNPSKLLIQEQRNKAERFGQTRLKN